MPEFETFDIIKKARNKKLEVRYSYGIRILRKIRRDTTSYAWSY